MGPTDRDMHRRPPADATPDEPRGALAAMASHPRPPARLEDRVVATLTRRGLLGTAPSGAGRSRAWRGAGMLAAGIALFVGGMLTGGAAARTRESDPGTPRFAILLYDGASPAAGGDETARVEEYRRWARGLAARGHQVSGEKLGDEARELTAAGTAAVAPPPADSGPRALAGFFIVSATSAAEAELIARSCPHLRYGGRVVVRPVDPT